jgi:hypothetical protein
MAMPLARNKQLLRGKCSTELKRALDRLVALLRRSCTKGRSAAGAAAALRSHAYRAVASFAHWLQQEPAALQQCDEEWKQKLAGQTCLGSHLYAAVNYMGLVLLGCPGDDEGLRVLQAVELRASGARTACMEHWLRCIVLHISMVRWVA